MASHRPLRLPPARFADTELPATPFRAGSLWRLHGRGQTARHFSLNPEHRFSHADCPFPMLYLGEAASTCIWERFGDAILNADGRISLALWTSRTLSRVEVPDLRLCDLTDPSTRGRARVDMSALLHIDLDVPRAWGLAIQRHPNAFDGLRYPSRFDGLPCIALFGRPDIRSRLAEAIVSDLADDPGADAFVAEHRLAFL